MPSRLELLIRRLGRRYGVVLAVVAALLLLDQAVLQPMLARLNLAAPVINLAGRQRMLSQSIATDVLAIALNSEAALSSKPGLGAKLAEWQRVHDGLKVGDVSLHLEEAQNPEIRLRLMELDRAVSEVSEATNQMIAERPAAETAIRHLLGAVDVFLPEMDRIVQLYERDAQEQVARLRRWALATTVIVITLMVGLCWLVLDPAVRLICQQITGLEAHERELEKRIEERTRQLSASHQALEEETTRRSDSEQRTLLLQSQLAHAARLNSLGELATGIAHELNQPLGAICNYAETLLILSSADLVNREALLNASSRVRDAALRAGEIIRRMRNFIRSRHGARAPEAIFALISEAVALCEPDLRSRVVAVRRVDELEEGAVAVIDAIQIQQVLVNLIRNAAQAVECRPVGRREVTIRTRQLQAGVEIDVEDNGDGFPEEFDLYATALRSTKSEGLGLGLSISRTIVEAHGGELRAGNNPHGGAWVAIHLPPY